MRRLTTPRRRLRSERGQALPLVVLSLVVLLSFAALAIDIARIWVAQQELQRAVDASALAAGQDLPDSGTAYTAAQGYSGTGGYGNAVGGWGVTPQAPTVTFECASHGPDYTSGSPPTCEADTSNDNCNPAGSQTPIYTSYTGSTPVTCNAVHVTETATVSVPLLSVFTGNVTVSASSTASSREVLGLPKPMNIFVILDTTESMDSSCSATVTGRSSPDKLDCAKEGVRTLLQAMPYDSGADDDVGIMVFPAFSSTLTGATGQGSTTTFSGTTTTTGSTTAKETITAVTTNESAYVGDAISGIGIPAGATITATGGSSGNYTVKISSAATSSGSHTFTITVPATTTYSLTPNQTLTTVETDETNCTKPSTSNTSSTIITYPPWANPTPETTGNTGGIPSSVLGNFGNYDSVSSGVVDNYPGYQAVPLSSNYLSSAGTLDNTSSLVESVNWVGQCPGGNAPAGDYYGIKDFPEDVSGSGQGSYLAGAITEAQYVLGQQPTTRTIDGQVETVTNGIVILSDGELNDIPKNGNDTDGVDPDAAGNITATSDTPCEDAIEAANQAKLDGTLVFSIAYDDSGGDCSDAGNGTGPPDSSTCPLNSNDTPPNDEYSGSGPYSGSACAMLQYLSTNGATSGEYFADQSDAGSLDSAFNDAVNELTGDSDLIPDCTAAPPGC